MSKILSKLQILECSDRDMQVVEVPEWKGFVKIQVMTGSQRDDFEQLVVSKKNIGNSVDTKGLKIRLLGLTIVDDNGKPLFTEADLEALNNKSAAVLGRLFDVAAEINGIGIPKIAEARKN